MSDMKESVVTQVDEYGTIAPYFTEVCNGSSGFLKYFHNIKGKRVKITIEVLGDEEENNQ